MSGVDFKTRLLISQFELKLRIVLVCATIPLTILLIFQKLTVPGMVEN